VGRLTSVLPTRALATRFLLAILAAALALACEAAAPGA